jgi:phosphate transport system substrate-binding protein
MPDDSVSQSDSAVSRRELLAGGTAAGAAALAGCVDALTPDDGDGDGLDVSGNVRISGSSTVYPVATAVAELFKEELANPDDVTFDISRDGSSGGFENVFIPGDSDINNASRAITDAEVQDCEDNGFEPVEFQIARDALTVIVNNDNSFIDSLTYDQLEAIWSPDDPARTWQDVNGDWPDEPIDLYGPASTSGTFDYFTETILGETGRIRSDFQGTEEDDQIASGVEGSEYALGYLPFAYYVNNPEETAAVSLAESAGDDPVEPSLEAASSGKYPLVFYANSNKLESKEVLQEFVRFYIEQSTDEELIANDIGYVPSSQDRADRNLSTLEEYAGN